MFGFFSCEEVAGFSYEAYIGGVMAGVIFEEFIPDGVMDLGVLFFDDGIEDIFMAHWVGVDFIGVGVFDGWYEAFFEGLEA